MAENTVTAKDGRKVSKKALAKSFRNWYYGNLTCFSQEHMQTFGYLWSPCCRSSRTSTTIRTTRPRPSRPTPRSSTPSRRSAP